MTDQKGLAQPGSTGAADDLAGKIVAWIAELATAATSFGLPAVSELCADVSKAWHRRNFRVAVVGEFNRGKSTIVNQLIGVPVIPTGRLPLTEGLVAVRGSSSPHIEIETGNGQRVKLPLRLDSWPANGEGDHVTVWVDSAWLQGGDIELIDTAGTNTAGADHLTVARRAVSQSDAAVICISAVQPLTETERQFLAREVLRRQAPHVVIALTMTDLIDAQAQEEVITKLRADLTDLGNPELVIAPGVNAATTAQLRELLSGLAARPGRAASRAPVLASILLDTTELCAIAAATGQALRQEDSAEQARALEELRQDPPGTSAQWNTLLAEFEMRGHELLSSLEDDMSRDCENLVNRYLAELRATQDPLTWWSEMLAVRAQADLKWLATECTAHLRSGVEQDMAWLETEAAAQFRFRARAPRVPIKTQEASFAYTTVPLTDTAAVRRNARLAGNAGALLAAAVAVITGAAGTVVFSAAGGLAGNLAGDKVVRRLNARNVSEAGPLLTAAMSDSSEQLASSLSALVPALYQDVGESFRDMAQAAQDSRLRAAQTEMAQRSAPALDWDYLADIASRIAEEINTTLANQKTF